MHKELSHCLFELVTILEFYTRLFILFMNVCLQIVDSQDLISRSRPLAELVEEYAAEDQIYRQKIQVNLLDI